MMSRREHERDYEKSIPVVRGMLLYLSVVIGFGCVVLFVQASMEEKKIRYRMADKNFEKMRLLDEIRRVDNEISRLERYDHIDEIVRLHLPALRPPRFPAIELPVAGLSQRTGVPAAELRFEENLSWPARFRQQWGVLEKKVKNWIRTFVE